MTDSSVQSRSGAFVQHALETVIRIGVIVLLAAWCFDIIRPFIGVVAWAVIIAIAVHPLYELLQSSLGERRRIAAMAFTLLMLLLLVTPTLALIETLVDGSRQLAAELGEGELRIPPPPEQVAEWPIVGKRVSDFWALASENVTEAVGRFKPQLKQFSAWLLGAAARAGLAVLTFIVAIVIAGVLLAKAPRGKAAAELIFTRLAGDRGEHYLRLSRSTIRSVAQGILGVALIQSVLAGLGFLAVGIPAAGVLALVTLLLCVVQLGPLLILLPTVIYVFMTGEPLVAGAYLVWSIFVALIDNVLKPLLLGRGVEVPVVVVFLGAIGGFLSMGIIGLFVGSIVLVLGYTLLIAWLGEGRTPTAAETET